MWRFPLLLNAFLLIGLSGATLCRCFTQSVCGRSLALSLLISYPLDDDSKRYSLATSPHQNQLDNVVMAPSPARFLSNMVNLLKMLMCRVLDLIVAPDSRERSLPPIYLADPLNSNFDRPIYTPILVVVDVEVMARSHSFVVVLGGRSASFVLSGLGLVDHAHHLLLQVLSLHRQAVLVPDKVWSAKLEVVALHAALEQ